MGSGRAKLEFAFRVVADETGLGGVCRALAVEGASDRRHVNDVAVIANSHRRLEVPVDASQVFQKPVDKVDAELLAVADDVDARGLLLLEPHERCILLAAA